MPAFNGNQVPPYVSLADNESVQLFANETVAANEISQVLCRANSPAGSRVINFSASYATTPTAVITIYGSNLPPTSSGPVAGESVGTISGNNALADNSRFSFYWAVVTSFSAGGNCTLIAKAG